MYIVETLTTTTPAKGTAVANLASAVSSVAIGYSSGPHSQISDTTSTCSLYSGTFLRVFFIYFFFAETKDRTLEETNEIFVSDLVFISDMGVAFTDCLVTGGE